MNLYEKTLLNAVNKIANAVKLTLGTKGRTVLYTNLHHDFTNKHERITPSVTKDGATVAKHIMSDNDYENLVISIIREASMKTMLSSGDGTTTTMILAQALITNGIKLLNEGMSFYELNKNMDLAVKDIVEYISNNSISIDKNYSLLKDIASISSNDEEIGKIIYSIIENLGIQCDIEVKESFNNTTVIEQVPGIKTHRGWWENFMCNDVKNSVFEAENCNVLIYDGEFSNYVELIKLIEYTGNEPFIIFCDDIGSIALSQLHDKFQMTPNLNLCFVQNDGRGVNRIAIMEDIALCTGTVIIDKNTSLMKNNTFIDNIDNIVGKCKLVKVTQSSCSLEFDEDYKDNETINDIVESIKYSIKLDEESNNTSLTPVEYKFMKKRLAYLTSGMCVIKVGARSTSEMLEIKDRYDDAVLAIYSALKNGISPGGGYTFIKCQKELKNKSTNKGYQLVIESIEQPFKQLIINSDKFNFYDKIKSKMLKENCILDLRTDQYYKVNSEEFKIYDATSVLLDALKNAISVAKVLLNSKEMIYNGVLLSDKTN